MNKEIKYTTDGKKVVIIGSLNSQEKIVQEIFIVDGSEIPSGEHFVVKSLHDSPAVSWKDKHLQDTEESYEKRKKSIDDALSRLNHSYREKSQKLEALNKYLSLVDKNFNPDIFTDVINLLTGKVTYIVGSNPYSGPSITKYEDWAICDERELKLLTLFGRDDGTLSFRINQYADGSGSYNQTTIYPFCNYEGAFLKFRELVQSAKVDKKLIALAKEHSIKLSPEAVSDFKKQEIDNNKRYIESKEKEIAKINEEIVEICKL